MPDDDALLDETSVKADPVEQFALWYEEAQRAGVPEQEAATLASATPDGKPSARVVLLRGYDARGFVFYTNYESRKGRELAANPRAALVFYWPEFARQVRIEGSVEQVSAEESDAYFRNRPRGHQLSAWVSRQSEVVASRAVLEQRMRQLAAQYATAPVPRPPYWGGYRVIPNVIEFWQGQDDRLHDRIEYVRQNGFWKVRRLSP